MIIKRSIWISILSLVYIVCFLLFGRAAQGHNLILGNALEEALSPGDDLEASIELTDMDDLKNENILLYYAIKDFKGNVLSFNAENITLEEDVTLLRTLKIPADIPNGEYVFYSKVSSKSITTSSSDIFEVSDEGESAKMSSPVNPLVYYGVAGLIASVILISVIVGVYKKRK